MLATSEAVTNAHFHGRPPVTLKAWLAPDRVLVDVGDAGPGPGDPLVGLLPAAAAERSAGVGLWLSHQLSVDVALLSVPEGFTVRLGACR